MRRAEAVPQSRLGVGTAIVATGLLTSLLWVALLGLREDGGAQVPGPSTRGGGSPRDEAPAADVVRLRDQLARLTTELEAERLRSTLAAPPPVDVERGPGRPDAAPVTSRDDAPAPGPGVPPGGSPAPTTPPAGAPGADLPESLRDALARLEAAHPGRLEDSPALWALLARLLLEDPADPEAALRCLVEARRHEGEPGGRRGRRGDWGDDAFSQLIEEIPADVRLPELERLAREEPNDDELQGDLGDALAELGRADEAATAFLRALELDPGDREWSEKLARLQPLRATATLERLSQERGDDDELLGDLADAYRESGRRSDALTAYTRAFTLDPRDSEWSGRIVELDPGRGVDLLSRALADQPNDSGMWAQLGQAYAALGRVDEARSAFGRALELDPDDDAALEQLTRMDPEGTIARLLERTREAPTDDELWGNLADAYARVGRRDDALRTYRHALELDPEDGEWPGKIRRLEAGR